MLKPMTWMVISLLLTSLDARAWADEYSDTIALFENAGESGNFFGTAFGYAVFPTIRKAAVGVGAAFGRGRVYQKGKHIGDVSMTQLTVGLQLGAQGYSEIIFFGDQHALEEFTSGNFEFGADASAVLVTAAVSAKTSTTGSSASASSWKKDAATSGGYRNKGIATFTLTKGGLMYEVSIGGQKFSYKPIDPNL